MAPSQCTDAGCFRCVSNIRNGFSQIVFLFFSRVCGHCTVNVENASQRVTGQIEGLSDTVVVSFPGPCLLTYAIRLDCCKQALSQLCAFYSPKTGILSDIAMFRQNTHHRDHRHIQSLLIHEKVNVIRKCAILCKVCTSEKQSTFATEIAIHQPGLSTPHIFLFPRILVCLDCGFTEFSIPETELPRLQESESTRA